jgi:hypothetical protein
MIADFQLFWDKASVGLGNPVQNRLAPTDIAIFFKNTADYKFPATNP